MQEIIKAQKEITQAKLNLDIGLKLIKKMDKLFKPKNRYSRGKIYKIEPLNGEDGDIYIGSTTENYLSRRLQGHKSQYKFLSKGKKTSNVRSSKLFDKYGAENCKIYLIENFPCESKNELLAREGYYIKSMKCVNKNVAQGITADDDYKRNYYIANSQQILEKYAYDYANKNKEIILQRCSDYRKNNPDKRRITNANYRKFNADKIKTHASKLVTCECGAQYALGHKSRHFQSQKHLNNI